MAERAYNANLAKLQRTDKHPGKQFNGKDCTLIDVYSSHEDKVIHSSVATGVTSYSFALENLLPLLNRFGEQRKIQSRAFYHRLKADIVTGCIMPPITLAFVREGAKLLSCEQISDYINENIYEGYILDGMQRLNTLREASAVEGFDSSRPLHLNIIVAEKYDLLLYRMITLNNGQRPMTARHQIEMLTKGAIDLSKLKIPVVTEKETEGTKFPGAFRMSDIVEAYTAYLTSNVNNQNKRIIEAKLDEILVGRVMDSDITEATVSFSDILGEIDRTSDNQTAKNFFKQVNNLIGFTVGAKSSIQAIRDLSPEDFSEQVNKFETAFDAINPSKVNVGKFRRELAAFFFENINKFKDADVSEVEVEFFEKTMPE